MRKLALVTALLVLVAGTALAGDYHRGASLICAQCHVMHGSQQHGYNADGTGDFEAIGAAGPYEFLLRDHINEMCLNCHDNSWGPDVLGADGGTNVPTHGRLAGFLNGTVHGAAVGNFASGHTLGSTDVAPGGTFTNADGLNCINCHTQHGRDFGSGAAATNQYRNLSIATQMTYAIGTNNTALDVFEQSASFGGDHYDTYNVDFNEPDPNESAYGEFCKGCHTDFHGAADSSYMRVQSGPAGQEWLRHPTADANIGAQGGGHSSLARAWELRAYRVKVMSPTGNWGTQGTAFGVGGSPTDLTPSCFSCHMSHGNANAFGLIYPTGTAPIGESGDGTQPKQLCKQCHVQG
jgi:hypothetical protein